MVYPVCAIGSPPVYTGEEEEVIAMSDNEDAISSRSSSEQDFEYIDFPNLIKEAQEPSDGYTHSIGRGPLIESTLVLFHMDDEDAHKVIVVTGDRGSGKTDLMLGTAHRIAGLKLKIRFFEWRIHYDPQSGLSSKELVERIGQDFNAWLHSQPYKPPTIVLLDTPLPHNIEYPQLFQMLKQIGFFERDIKLIITTIPAIHNPLIRLIEDSYRIPSAIIDLTTKENSTLDSCHLKEIVLQQVGSFYTSEAIEEVIRAVLQSRERKQGEKMNSTLLARPPLTSDIARLNTIIDATNAYAKLHSHPIATVDCVKGAVKTLVMTGNLHVEEEAPPYLHMYS